MNKQLLNYIYYEKIKDNFYYGKFTNSHAHACFKLVIDKNTNCFNATTLCKDGEKDFHQFQSRNFTSEYEIMDQTNKEITGKYVEKDFILDIAEWISIKFYKDCNQIINDYLITFPTKTNIKILINGKEWKG